MPEIPYNTDLDALVGAIESIQDRIKRDHSTIGANETRTRDALINPLLGALGWADPSVVTSEYLIRYGRGAANYGVADYALHSPGGRAQPFALVEAKRMNEDLSDDHRNQIFEYAANRESVKYAILTNGDCWELYEFIEEGRSLQACLMLDLSIRRESAYDCAVQLLPLKQDESDDFAELGAFEDTEDFEAASPVPAFSTQFAKPLVPSYVEMSRPFPAPPAIELARAGAVDVGKVLAWLGVTVVVCGITSYIIGFWLAQPIFDTFAGVGAIVVGIVAIAVATLILPRLPWHLLWDLLWRSGEGDARRTLVWLGVAVVVGGIIGGVTGYFTGAQTAQSIANMLAIMGALVVVGALFAVMVVLAKSRESPSKPRSRLPRSTPTSRRTPPRLSRGRRR